MHPKGGHGGPPSSCTPRTGGSSGAEDNFSGAYDKITGAIVVQADTLTVPGASTGLPNSLNVWLSGITYKGV
jgi:hypothetical protein